MWLLLWKALNCETTSPGKKMANKLQIATLSSRTPIRDLAELASVDQI